MKFGIIFAIIGAGLILVAGNEVNGPATNANARAH